MMEARYDADTVGAVLLGMASKWVARPLLMLPWPWWVFRAAFAMVTPRRRAAGLTVEWRDVGGVPCRIASPGPAAPALVWCHGGAFVAGSPNSHARITDRIARRGFRVVVPRYRLAPEHPFPAGFQDCLAVAGAMSGREPIALGGDSAGATLAASVLARLLLAATPPVAVALIAPAAELDPARRIATGADPMFLSVPMLQRILDAYAPGADPSDPDLSPGQAAFPACPPVTIHCSAGELLEEDSLRLGAAMEAGGGAVTLVRGRGLPHAWHLAAGFLRVADDALSDLGDFLASHGTPNGTPLDA
ncbi:alpha/beta hydrolase fold domain-containing protein [Jannaschia sp. LMIT008]|uniref:alpha/beta hydrolase fold domain-containing protein n=1 Tax=Jannaschia maritima TaxID=3032585 RepID=UPI002812378F|nr:alpha/beta hydrolase fold domain-containing protein [Jannaschia sp. LMIT008]